MKKLTLIRHGKSTWEYQVRDHDRVLKERGIQDAHLIGSYLKKNSFNSDIYMSSSAARALQTATLVCEYLDYNLKSLSINRSLYTFSKEELESVVLNANDDLDHITIFSHNHGITEFVNHFGDIYFDNIPTTGCVTLEFSINSWKDLNPGKTISHIFPKQLR